MAVLALISLRTIFALLLILNLVGMSIAAYHVMRRK
jgi:hypothetical protein